MSPRRGARKPRGQDRDTLIVDTHTHLSRDRATLVQDLRHRAYFGVGAAMSLGQDNGTAVFEVRGETIPGAALYRTAGRGITAPEPGAHGHSVLGADTDEARNAVRSKRRSRSTS